MLFLYLSHQVLESGWRQLRTTSATTKSFCLGSTLSQAPPANKQIIRKSKTNKQTNKQTNTTMETETSQKQKLYTNFYIFWFIKSWNCLKQWEEKQPRNRYFKKILISKLKFSQYKNFLEKNILSKIPKFSYWNWIFQKEENFPEIKFLSGSSYWSWNFPHCILDWHKSGELHMEMENGSPSSRSFFQNQIHIKMWWPVGILVWSSNWRLRHLTQQLCRQLDSGHWQRLQLIEWPNQMQNLDGTVRFNWVFF